MFTILTDFYEAPLRSPTIQWSSWKLNVFKGFDNYSDYHVAMTTFGLGKAPRRGHHERVASRSPARPLLSSSRRPLPPTFLTAIRQAISLRRFIDSSRAPTDLSDQKNHLSAVEI